MTEKPDRGSIESGLPRLLAVLSRTTLLLLVWWVLTDGVAPSWWIGAPAVMLAVGVSILLLPPQHFSWMQLIRFLTFFFRHSLRGGADVAWRAFHPALPIAPDIVEYRLNLPPGLPRVVMAGAVNLLPGTLGAMFDQNVLKVHVLDRHADFRSELGTIERRVAGMFRALPDSEQKD